MTFNKDTRIGELLEVAPEKADILLEIGMHCLGCPASQMETRANGVGAKGANRVIMELKDKLRYDDVISASEEDSEMNGIITSVDSSSSGVQDTVLALVSLGYSEFEAMKAVKQVPGAEDMDSDKLLKAALKKIF